MGWRRGLILAAIQEPFAPPGTDRQDGPLDLRWSGWACLGLGSCPQGASVYPRAVPTRWEVGAEVGAVLLGHGVGSGGDHIALGPVGTRGVSPMLQWWGSVWTLYRVCPGGGESIREGLLWTKIDIFPSSSLLCLFSSCAPPPPFRKEEVWVGNKVRSWLASALFPPFQHPGNGAEEVVRNSAFGQMTWIEKVCDLGKLHNLSEPQSALYKMGQ